VVSLAPEFEDEGSAVSWAGTERTGEASKSRSKSQIEERPAAGKGAERKSAVVVGATLKPG
jgi:hypothetical protein